MPIRVSCQCGKSFQAPDNLAGKTVQCPSCKSPLAINKPSDSSFLDELSDIESAAMQARGASSSGVGGELSSAAAGLGLGAGGMGTGTLQMGSKKKNAVPVAAIAIGGIIAVAALILILILVTGGKDSEDERGTEETMVASTKGEGSASSAKASKNTADIKNGMKNVSNAIGGFFGGSGDTENKTEDDEANTSSSSSSSSGGAAGRPNRSESGRRGGNRGRSRGGRGRNNNNDDDNDEDDDEEKDELTSNELMRKQFHTGVKKWYKKSKELVASREMEDRESNELETAQYGWMVELLPFIDKEDEYDKFDFEERFYAKDNIELAQTVHKEFLNPKDERELYTGNRFTGFPLSHFAGMSGIEEDRNEIVAKLPRSDPRAGMFGYKEIVRKQDIKDGASKTLMLIGTGKLAGPWISSGGSTVRGVRRPLEGEKGDFFHKTWGFGSLGHKKKKGAIVLMADGSLKWISHKVDDQVFLAMCTVAGGDSVDLSSLVSYPSSSLPWANASVSQPGLLNAVTGLSTLRTYSLLPQTDNPILPLLKDSFPSDN